MKKKGKGRGRGSRDAKPSDCPVREQGQVYARVTKMQGSMRVLATGTDGREHACKIAGRMRKREWVNVGDLVLVSLREFDGSKADLVYRYSDAEARQLCRMGEDVHVPRGEDAEDDEDLIRFEQAEASDDAGSIDLEGL